MPYVDLSVLTRTDRDAEPFKQSLDPGPVFEKKSGFSCGGDQDPLWNSKIFLQINVLTNIER